MEASTQRSTTIVAEEAFALTSKAHIEHTIQAIRAATARATVSQEAARAFLNRAGIPVDTAVPNSAQ